jgi:hypothetical protein
MLVFMDLATGYLLMEEVAADGRVPIFPIRLPAKQGVT